MYFKLLVMLVEVQYWIDSFLLRLSYDLQDEIATKSRKFLKLP
jgi:hypothetical protein